MILTAAVSAGKQTIDSAYDISEMAKYLDLLNVMTYDFHGSWESQTHHHSSLKAHPKDTGGNLYLNQVNILHNNMSFGIFLCPTDYTQSDAKVIQIYFRVLDYISKYLSIYSVLHVIPF